MSIARQILSAVHAGVAVPLHGDALQLQDDNQTPITGILNPEPQLMPEFSIQVDPREVAQFDVQRPVPKGTFNGATRRINANDLLYQTVTVNGSPHQWKVIKQDDNPAVWVITYWLQRLVPGKDYVDS